MAKKHEALHAVTRTKAQVLIWLGLMPKATIAKDAIYPYFSSAVFKRDVS